METLKALALAALLFAAPCMAQDRTISQSIVYAVRTADEARALSASLVGRITADQARDVGESADVVAACAVRMRSLAAAGDAVGAQAQLGALEVDLHMLEQFLATWRDKGKR